MLDPTTMSPKASQFNVPPFPGLLGEMDFEAFIRTPPETRDDWVDFTVFNKKAVEEHKGCVAAWEHLVHRVNCKPPRVVFSTTYVRDYDRSVYVVGWDGLLVPLAFTGIFAHFYHRVKSSLVMNGIPSAVVETHLFTLEKKAASYQSLWVLGYDVQTGNITIFDRAVPSGHKLYRGGGTPPPPTITA